MTPQLLTATVILATILLIPASAAATAATSAVAKVGQQQQQRTQPPSSLCANSVAADACRGFRVRQPTGRGCHEQLLLIMCSVRSLRCPGQSQATPASLENPVCQQSCLRVFRRCASSDLSLFSYLSISDHLCLSLPDQLCHDWRESTQRDDRSIGSESGDSVASDARRRINICQSGSAQCNQVVYIGDISRRHRRGAAVKLRHPFKKSNFRQGNYTYAAVVKLAKAEWLQEAASTAALQSQSPRQRWLRLRTRRHPAAPVEAAETAASAQQQPRLQHNGGYEKVLHLEILQVLYTRDGGGGGHILDPGSVQIVRLAPGCACAPVKLEQSLIFVGYNSYLENVWKTVTLLPNNGHYVCKIKRCWNKRKRSPDETTAGGGGVDCDCPCGKSERRRCQKRRLHAKRRRGAGGGGAGGGGGGGGGVPRTNVGRRRSEGVQPLLPSSSVE